MDDARAFLQDEYLDELDALQKKIRKVEKLLIKHTKNDAVVEKTNHSS